MLVSVALKKWCCLWRSVYFVIDILIVKWKHHFQNLCIPACLFILLKVVILFTHQSSIFFFQLSFHNVNVFKYEKKQENQCMLTFWCTELDALHLKVARAWRETTPVCSGLTRLVRAGYSRHDPGASREPARITRRAQDGSVHMQLVSRPAPIPPGRL